MVNFKKCCRLCLKDEESLQNFDCRDTELCAKINQHFDVSISEDDELSTKICQECASKVYNFAVFYNSIQLNQQQLKFSMEIHKKVSEIKEEDDDCVIIEVETDDLLETNESINSTQKRSADVTSSISNNNDMKQKIPSLCPMNNIQSTSNNIIAETQDTLNTKVEKDASTTNEIVEPSNILTPTNQMTENNFDIINIKSINNSEIPCFPKDMTNYKESSLNNLQIFKQSIKIKKKFHQKLINKIRLLQLSDSNKNAIKLHKCKNSYVKLKRLSTLENKLNQINSLIESNVSDLTDKNIEREILNLNNIKRLTVEKIKGKISKELTGNNAAKELTGNNMNKNSSEKLSHSENIQIVKSSKTLKQNNDIVPKKSSKQNVSSNKCSIACNEETINKNSMELKNTRSSMCDNSTKDNKNKTIKIASTEIIETTNCTPAIKKINNINTLITKSINNTETMHQTQNQQLSNIKHIPVILNAHNSKFETLHPTNIQSSNEQPKESFSIDLNANQFESMMKQTENSQSPTPNVLISTTENTSTSIGIMFNPNLTYSTASTKSTELSQNKSMQPKINTVKQPIISNILQLPQNMLTTATINKTPINNKRKSPAELYTKHLLPPKLPKGQSLNESFYWQNQIQTSKNGNNEKQNLSTISTSPTVVVASTSQAAVPLMSTIQQHLNTSIAPRTVDFSNFTVYNKVSDTSGGIIPTVNSTTTNRIDINTNKNIVITKNLQSINTIQKPHTQNNQQQLQRNNSQHVFTQKPKLNEPTTQQQIQNALQQNQSIINKKSTQQQQNLQINISNQQQIQQYNNQQQMQQNSQAEKQSPYVFNKIQNNSTGRVKILTVPELNQKAANNQLLYNKLPVTSTSVTPITSFPQISYSSIQPLSHQQRISKNNLSRTKIVATLPIVHAENSIKPRISVKILVHSENKNQLTIKLNNLATGKLCHYWDLSEQQKEAVKQSLSAIDKKSVEKFKPYQLDDYAKNLLDRINFIEFRNNFAL